MVSGRMIRQLFMVVTNTLMSVEIGSKFAFDLYIALIETLAF